MPATLPSDFFKQYRPWQWIKHMILSEYLVPWSMKVGSTSSSIFVVDLFAGAGVYEDSTTGKEFPGSPLIAARRARSYLVNRPSKKMHVICVEKDKQLAEKLGQRLKPFGSLATLHRGGFAEHLDAVSEAIGNSPALLLIDPIGLTAIPAKECAKLLQRVGKTDVFVILDFQYIHRTGGQLLSGGAADPGVSGSAANAANIGAFFGGDGWRQVAVDPSLDKEVREDKYIGMYFAGVLGSRYRYQCAYPVKRRHDAPARYWLVHASDHPDGFWLMNDEIVKVDERLVVLSNQKSSSLHDFEQLMVDAARADLRAKLKAAILELLEQTTVKRMRFSALRSELLDPYFGKVRSGVYAAVLKELVNEGRVTRENPRANAAIADQEWIGLA
jgi:three-Cys-motif partner protein